MNLFINAISKNSYIALFNDERYILSSKFFNISWNESSLLIPSIEAFLKENHTNFKKLKNIVIVNWPGSFTWVRTNALVANSIAFITDVKLSPISYFDLFKEYPIIKSSSKRDSFFKLDENEEIKIIPNEKIEELLIKKWINTIYWEWDLKSLKIFEKIDYSCIIKDIKLKKLKRIEALYLKKPNIC